MKKELIVCQHGDRRIAMINNNESSNPDFETVVDNYNGKDSIVQMI